MKRRGICGPYSPHPLATHIRTHRYTTPSTNLNLWPGGLMGKTAESCLIGRTFESPSGQENVVLYFPSLIHSLIQTTHTRAQPEKLSHCWQRKDTNLHLLTPHHSTKLYALPHASSQPSVSHHKAPSNSLICMYPHHRHTPSMVTVSTPYCPTIDTPQAWSLSLPTTPP